MFNEEVESDEEQDEVVEEEAEGQDDAEDEAEDPEEDDIFSKDNNEGEEQPDDSFRFNQHE